MTRTKWNLKRGFGGVVFAAATFAASFVLGGAITSAFGPGTSGIFTIVITTILVVVGARLLETPGILTLMVTLFTVLAIPTNMFGPPGPQKILIGLMAGVAYDLVWELTGRRRLSLPLAASVSTAVAIILIFILMIYLGHPRKEFMQKFIYYLVPFYAVLGFVGGLLGNLIYDKSLSRLSVVQQFKA